MKTSSTSKRLKQIMSDRKIKQVDILNMIKDSGNYISKSALSQYVNGHSEPDQEKLTILSSVLGVSETWLMGYDAGFGTPNNLVEINYPTKKIPLIGTISAGEPILAKENIEEYIDLEKEVQADFALRVNGDSMINAGINSGDIVFIRKQPDVEDGEIAAVLIEDTATLKRVYKMAGKVILRAENPLYSPIELNGSQPVSIIGKATYKFSKVL